MEESADYEALPNNSTLRDHMMAGAFAGIMEHIVMYPLDSVKTRMQCFQPLHSQRYPNVISGLIRLVQAEGILGSLRGIGAMVGGAGPAHAAYFGCYEHVKSLIEDSSVSSSLAPLIGGACATLLHDAVMTPADAVKQRLQMFHSPYHNTLDCLRRVCRNEGPSVLYRAYLTQLTMNVPYQAMHFVTYETAQDFFNPSRRYLPWTHVLSGGVAGGLAAAFTNPLDVCKTMLNTQDRYPVTTGSGTTVHKSPHQSVRIPGLIGAARLVYELDGARGFTRGVGARILTAVPGTAISWSVYEYFKWVLKNRSQHSDSESGSRGAPRPGDAFPINRPVILPASSEVSCAVPSSPIESLQRETLSSGIPIKK